MLGAFAGALGLASAMCLVALVVAVFEGTPLIPERVAAAFAVSGILALLSIAAAVGSLGESNGDGR